MRAPLGLSVEQRKWLKRRLEIQVKGSAKYNRSLSGKGETDINTRFWLKLMNNAIRILNDTPKKSMILFDIYTIGMLEEECERFLKQEPNMLKIIDQEQKNQDQNLDQENLEGSDTPHVEIYIPTKGFDKNRFLGGLHNDLEMYNTLLETVTKICHNCISSRESMKGV